jgi:putative two-component system response regulator
MVGKILVVDDSSMYRTVISSILKDYSLIMAEDGLQALSMLEKHDDIDMMILDLNMPNLDGFGVLDAINQYKQRELTTIILTNVDEIESEIKGLEAGAVDYIRKPIHADSLQKRIEVHSRLISAQKEILKQNQFLEDRIRDRTMRLEATRKLTIDALLALLEIRNAESSNHGKRTRYLMKALGKQLLKNSPYKEYLTIEWVDEIYKTAPLHDIGKVGIKDKILLKPGKLTPEEFEEMKCHVKYGADALRKNIDDYENIPYTRTALHIIEDHHERFDGKGYPEGKIGEEISIEGRMMAIIDVYDALRSKRVYKEAYSHERSMSIIDAENGKHFDPVIVDAFHAIEDQVIEIINKYSTEE